MSGKVLRVGALAGALLLTPLVPARADGAIERGAVERGAEVYRARCGACHALDANRVGPRHRGVFGRRAGSQPGYAYSAALSASDVVWEEETLDRWLRNPQALVPGQKMGFRLSNAKERADVIAFLRHSGKEKGAP